MSRAKSRKTYAKDSGWCVAPTDSKYDLPAHLFNKKEEKKDDGDSDA